MNPETLTATTARSGRATDPVLAPEPCDSAGDGTCTCRPFGRGVAWSMIWEDK